MQLPWVRKLVDLEKNVAGASQVGIPSLGWQTRQQANQNRPL